MCHYKIATSLLLIAIWYQGTAGATNELYAAASSVACTNVQEKLRGLKDAVEELCGGSSVTIPTVRNTWTSVPMTSIGSTNLRHANTISFVIPNVIPLTAKNVLIYIALSCGYANRGTSLHLKIFTQDGSNKRFEKYLYLVTWNQSAINTNSDNMWFPMPTNRRIYMTVDKDAGTNCGAYLYAIGYN